MMSLAACELDSVSVRIINKPFVNTIICSNIKRDILVETRLLINSSFTYQKTYSYKLV
jgi:hypothetical protein